MLFRILTVAAIAIPMFADDRDDWRRERREDRREARERDRELRRRDDYRNNNGRYGYGNQGYGYGGSQQGYGYGNNGRVYGGGGGGVRNNASSILNQTMRDLQSAAQRNRVDSHERDHFNRAMSELQNMRYDSPNNVDSRRLSRVLEDLDHLSRADQVHPRDRQILARDRQALASMYGGYGYNRW